MNPHQQHSNSGFTLIELVVVMLLLGLVAISVVPKFIDLSGGAEQAKVDANIGALQSAVDLANLKWRAIGAPSDAQGRNDVQLYGAAASGTIDFNSGGWPAQSSIGLDTSVALDSDNDCLSIWGALMEDGINTAALDSSTEFQANYEGGGNCSYLLVANNDYGIEYDSNNGEVTEYEPPSGGGGSILVMFLITFIGYMIRAISPHYRERCEINLL